MAINKSSSANAALKVDIRPASTVQESVNSSWSVISTDFIPVDFDVDYNVGMQVSAKDVNQLHSKVIYYDSSKKEIGWNFVFGGRDGLFQDEFTYYVLPQMETKYMKIQMWVRPTLDKNGSYILDNVKLESKVPQLNVNKINKESPKLVIERIFARLNSTTGEAVAGPNMAFLGPDDLLMLEGDSGKVMRIVNGTMLEEPLIDLNVYVPDGLVGIAITKNKPNSTFVFLYFDEAPTKYGGDVNTAEEASQLNETLGHDREGDRVYRYQLIGNKLLNPKLLMSIPDKTTNIIQEAHHGGEVIMGPDNAVYVAIGDIDGYEHPNGRTKAQNYNKGTEPDGRAGILRIGQDGHAIGNGMLGSDYPLDLYYAYGIRNSFGMDFDPVTRNLWDTENGPNYGDEINLVNPGFNSGWNKVQGFWRPNGEEKGKRDLQPTDLVDFEGKGTYSGPEFTWINTVGPTAIKFFNSDKFGPQFRNDMFVADVNNGNIYHFDLNENRTSLLLHGALEDKIADSPNELDDVIFAKGFTGIVDLQVGPDGFLYVLSNGSIYKIHPANQ
jgi:glucose/arabinose dehydrogenase